MRKTFNEPVSPLVIRIIAPNGEVIAPKVSAENATLTLTPPRLQRGTHALSWRVVSADGHPVGGSIIFSIGAPSALARPQEGGDAVVRAALWAGKLVIYAGLFVGIGGAFFRACLADPAAPPARRRAPAILALLAAGLVATALSVGLQGLDALDLPIANLGQAAAWQAGMQTAYGATAITAAAALLLSILAQATRSVQVARALSIIGLLGAGVALALSGHAGTVEPRLLTRSAVFLHSIGVAFWIGAFVPLLVAVADGQRGRGVLARFTRLIPYPLAVLVATGAGLALVQLDRIDALWTTRYGAVLSLKLAAVIALLGLAAANRFVLVPRLDADSARTARPLAASIAGELALALAILALVALWRFTPPPRALAAAEHVSIHFHGERAMTQIEIEPKRGRGADVDVQVLDHDLHPLVVKEVTLVFSNPAAGIEPLRRSAIGKGDAVWRIDDLRIPIAGRWRLRVELLISDFDKEVLEDQVELPRVP